MCPGIYMWPKHFQARGWPGLSANHDTTCMQVVCGHLIQLFWSEQTGDLRHGDQYKLESAPAVLLAVGETVILLTSPLDPY